MEPGKPVILLTHELQTRLKRFVTDRLSIMDVISNCIKLGLEVMEKEADGYSLKDASGTDEAEQQHNDS